MPYLQSEVRCDACGEWLTNGYKAYCRRCFEELEEEIRSLKEKLEILDRKEET